MQSPMGGKKIKRIIFHLALIFMDYSQNIIFIKVRNMPTIFFWYGHCPRIHKILENVFFQNPRKLMLITNIDKNTVQVLNFLNSKSWN